jgi:hypothetical protein
MCGGMTVSGSVDGKDTDATSFSIPVFSIPLETAARSTMKQKPNWVFLRRSRVGCRYTVKFHDRSAGGRCASELRATYSARSWKRVVLELGWRERGAQNAGSVPESVLHGSAGGATWLV